MLRHRSLNVEYNEPSEIRLEDFRIEIDINTVDEKICEKLLKDDYSISDFYLTTDNDDRLSNSREKRIDLSWGKGWKVNAEWRDVYKR